MTIIVIEYAPPVVTRWDNVSYLILQMKKQISKSWFGRSTQSIVKLENYTHWELGTLKEYANRKSLGLWLFMTN